MGMIPPQPPRMIGPGMIHRVGPDCEPPKPPIFKKYARLPYKDAGFPWELAGLAVAGVATLVWLAYLYFTKGGA